MCSLPSFGCAYRLVGWISASVSEVARSSETLVR